jgi:hypothetical protein
MLLSGDEIEGRKIGSYRKEEVNKGNKQIWKKEIEMKMKNERKKEGKKKKKGEETKKKERNGNGTVRNRRKEKPN